LRPQRIGFLEHAAVAAISVAMIACSSPSLPAQSHDSIPTPDPTEAGLPPMADAATPPPGIDAGLGVGVHDVEDTACAGFGGTSVPVSTGLAGGAPLFRSLQAVGTRRVADLVSGAGYLTFDADGSNPMSAIGRTTIAAGSVASSGNAFFFGGTAAGVDFLVCDANGAPQGQSVSLSGETPTTVALAASASGALFAWGGPNGVRGRGVDGTAPAGSGAFDLALTDLTGQLSLSVIDDGNGLFAFVFSGDNGGDIYQTVFGRATTAQRTGDPVATFTGATPRQVVQVAKTANGYALLFTAGGAAPFAGLAILDSTGSVVSIGRLLGASGGLALAVQGSELGVTATRATTTEQEGGPSFPAYAPEFRAFDQTGAPLGPWVCLQDPSSNAAIGAVLTADGAGYAALINASDGTARLARFDHLGTGPQ
jgi:hypothetical protein